MNGAAEEKSPGTSISPSSSRSAGQTLTRAAAALHPRARRPSIRSVWSRVGSGSTTVVAPSRVEAGEQHADFTCALATGSS